MIIRQSAYLNGFQSTLPYGSDLIHLLLFCSENYFNPRSLTGATWLQSFSLSHVGISIHAPLRERLLLLCRLIIT